MATKTIRGVVTTTELAEGDTAEVEYTDHIKGLIEGGYVELVEREDEEGAEPGQDERGQQRQTGQQQTSGDQAAPDEQPTSDQGKSF